MTSKTQFYGASSLDGFLATPDDRIDWLMQFGDVPPSYAPFIAQIGAIAMGAATYEWLIRNHVKPDSGTLQPWPYAQPTWIFSHHRYWAPREADIRFVSGEVAPVHAEMVAEAKGKSIWLVGGGELVGQFWDRGLLDELIVQVTSVTLGAGKPLLPVRFTPRRCVCSPSSNSARPSPSSDMKSRSDRSHEASRGRRIHGLWVWPRLRQQDFRW